MEIIVEIDKQPFEKLAEFLAKLSKLSEEYEIYIAGCGCCGSPYLEGDGLDEKYIPLPSGNVRPGYGELGYVDSKGIYTLYMGYQMGQLETWVENRTKELKGNESDNTSKS